MVPKILQRLTELSQPFPPTARWDFLAPCDVVRSLPSGAGPLLASLRKEFSDEQLCTAQLAVTTATGSWELAPALAAPPGIFAVLRSQPDAPPHDLLLPRGQLLTADPPCFAAPEDYTTRQALKQAGGRLFAAMDLQDLAILQTLGLPATLAVGLDQLDGAQLRRLCPSLEPVEASQREEPTVVATERSLPLWAHAQQLVLVGWSVCAFDGTEPSVLKDMIELLASAARAFDLDLEALRVWRPRELDLLQIRLAARLRDTNFVRRMLVTSVEHAAQSISDYASSDVPQPSSQQAYLALHGQLHEQLRREQQRGIRSSQIPGMLARFRRAFEQVAVEPLVQRAMQAADPLDGVLLLHAAELLQQWHNTSALVEGCGEDTCRHGLPWQQPSSEAQWKERLGMVDRLLAIRREVRRGEK
jgi:hypothetical protein